MSHRTTLLLGYFALALALAAVVLRIARGRVDDWTDVLGPIAIALFMVSVIMRERRRVSGGDDRG